MVATQNFDETTGVSILLNKGGGAFRRGKNYDLGPKADLGGVGDVNGDGFPDVIAGGIGLDNAAQCVANAGGAELILGFRTRQTIAPPATLHGVRFTD